MRSMPSAWKPCPGPATALSARRNWKKACWKKRATDLLNGPKKIKGDAIGISFFLEPQNCLLVKIEGDFNIHLNRYGAAVFLGRIELPGLYPFNGFLIQAHAQ